MKLLRNLRRFYALIRDSLTLVLISSFFSLIYAQENTLKPLGNIKTKNSKEIESSRWSIGGETLDRDYANYDAYKSYLDGLGAKWIRLQGGWAKCEQVKGQYDFKWLDKIVDDAKSRGIEPWVQLSYGNPIYEGGGQPILAGGIPTSEEALKAWDNWVVAIVRNYKSKIKAWEIWNEPDISKKFHVKDFIPFYERTVALVKKEQPDSKIIGLGLADVRKVYYVDSLLQHLKQKNKLNYVDAISFHGYTIRPEDNYNHFSKLKDAVKAYKSSIELWQGENGAPSTPRGQAVGALTKDQDWSETTQAKWNLRRMLGDMAYGVDVTNIFQISDMYYAGTDHLVGLNSKGLLKANPDRSIAGPKLAYAAYQHAATLFSGQISKINASIVNEDIVLEIHAYQKAGSKGSAITIWSAEGKPQDSYPEKNISFTVKGVDFSKPVLVDLLTGRVFEINKSDFSKKGDEYAFKNIPVTDSPIVIVEKSWIEIVTKK